MPSPDHRNRRLRRTSGPESLTFRRLSARRRATAGRSAQQDNADERTVQAPNRKARNGPAAAVPDTAAATAAEATTAAVTEGKRTRRRLNPLSPFALGVVTVILGGMAAWSGSQAHGLNREAVRNVALTDSARTSEVQGEITNAVNTIFSYSYTDLAKTERAAQTLLTGEAVQQYDSMLKPVRERAAKDRLVLTTTVTDCAVELLVGDRARLLIFADQRNTRTTDNQTTYAGAMLAVDAARQGGKWRITNLDTLTRTPPG